MAYYGAYFLIAIPASLVARRFGYKGGVICGLCLFVIGSFITVPAMNAMSYGIVEKLDDAYKSSMEKLATLPNLYVKVSGFPTKDPTFVGELLSFIRDTFPPYKLMYASNWPVVEMYSTFAENFNVLHETFGDDENGAMDTSYGGVI